MDHDETTSFEMTEEEVLLARTLRRHISSGDINNARSLIENVSLETRHRLTKPNQDPPLPAALFHAIDNGNMELVKLLVDHCGANFHEKIWVRGWSCLDAWLRIHIINKKWMSPLEMSIWRNTPDIVEYFVSIGADVHSVAKDVETMHTACRRGSLKIVQILLDHGADVNASDEKGRTCLMAAVRHVGLCRFLIDKGADINKIDSKGNSALHKAAKWNDLSAVKLFLERGADALCKNNDGFDVLHLACRYTDIQKVDILIKTVFTDVNRHIEALKFLAISLFYDEDDEDALPFWKRAIELSSQCGIVAPATTLQTPFGVVVEATTLSELDELSHDSDQLYMQCVLLAHKMFGPTHTEFFYAICEVIRYFVEVESHERLMQMVIYCFEMIQNSNLAPQRRCLVLKRFHAAVKVAILNFDASPNKAILNFDLVYDYTRKVVEMSIICTHVEETERLMKLVVDGALLFTYTKFDKLQKMNFYELMQSAIRTSRGRTLMIVALKRFERRNFRPNSSHLEAIDMLLECGADVNERDEGGNTVLHILMAAPSNIRYRSRVQLHPTNKRVKTLALKFVENGVHFDARNHQGLVATSFLKKAGINVVPPINLMCSAARAIRRLNIPVEGVLPKFLIDFVEMH